MHFITVQKKKRNTQIHPLKEPMFQNKPTTTLSCYRIKGFNEQITQLVLNQSEMLIGRIVYIVGFSMFYFPSA
jgi:hypothetical protein